MKIKCPCCGSFSFDEKAGNGDICPECFWEYDRIQQEDPDYRGGANSVSLAEARENYARFGACEERFAARRIWELTGNTQPEDGDD